MSRFYYFQKKLVLVSMSLFLLSLGGCDKEEDSAVHLRKGVDYINKGEYEKAKLELKTSSQSGKESAETYYALALLDEKNRQFKNMMDNLNKTLELAPSHTDARLKLIKLLILKGDFDIAMQQTETVLKSSSQNTDALALKALVLAKQKKTDESLALIDSLLTANPNNVDALSLKASIYIEKEQTDKAMSFIDTALKVDEKNVSLNFLKIQMHAKAGNINAVIEDYKKLLSLYPNEFEYKATLAKIYIETGKTKDAESILQGLVDAQPASTKPKILFLDYLANTDEKRVLDKFREYVEIHKEEPRRLFELAQWMIAKKNFNEARIVLDKVIDLQDDDKVGLPAKLLKAKMSFDEKNFADTEKLVDEMLATNSNYDDAKLLRIRLMLVKEHYDEAIKELNKLLLGKADYEDALLLLGQIYLITGDKAQADKNFAGVLAINPANMEALTNVYEKYVSLNDYKYAKNILEKALQRQPDNIDLLEKLARMDVVMGDWDGAKAVAGRIASLPTSIAKNLADYIQAQVLQGQGDYAKAAEIYKGLLSKFPENSDALGNLARCYEKMNKRSEMISFLNELLAKNSRNISGGILLGDLYALDKQFDKAAELFSNLIKINPKIPLLYASLADIKLAQNDKKGAIVIYQDGIKVNPMDIKLSLSLATLYESQGQYNEAISIYETLLATNPRLDVAINNLANALVEYNPDEEKLKKAVKLAEKFKSSDQPYFQDTYAWILVKQGQYKEAINILSKIIAASPDVPVFKYHMGVALYNDKNSTEAMQYLMQAVDLGDKYGGFSNKKETQALLDEILKNKGK